MVSLTGCDLVERLVRPTTAPTRTAPTSGAQPRARPSPTPLPTPSPTAQSSFSLLVTDDPVQYWSDPNDVTGLVHDGTFLWAATPSGVVRWSAAGEPRLYAVPDGLASQAILGIALDGDGHVWVGYSDHPGWSEHDGESWRTYDTREKAVEARYEAMLRAPRSDPRLWASRAGGTRVWLPTVDGMIKSYDGAAWRTYGPYSGVTRETWLVTVSREGRVWAIGEGVSTAMEGERWWDDHTFFSSIVHRHHITDAAVDDTGVWLAFTGPREQGGGVCRLEWENNRWRGYLHELNPAIPYQVYGVRVDRDGTIWLCGDGALARRSPSRPWRVLAVEGADVRSFARDPQGDLWLGSNQGIWLVPDGEDQAQGPWRVPTLFTGSKVAGIVRDAQGRLWIGTSRSVSYVDAAGGAEIVAEDEVLCLARDPAGSVWVGAATGLYRMGEDGLARQHDQSTTAVAFDAQGIPWVCTPEGQLLRLDASGPQVIADILALAGTLPRNMVLDTQGTLWLATARGLGSLSPDGAFHLATVEDGLLSEDVRAVALDVDDTLWMATAKGLARRRADGRWTRFTTESTEGGLRAMEMWDVAVDAQGDLWMATEAGVSRRTPQEADWSYYDVPKARHVLYDPEGVIWVGTDSGLYRLRADLLTAVP